VGWPEEGPLWQAHLSGGLLVSFHVPELRRMSTEHCKLAGLPEYGSTLTDGNNGCFLLPALVPGRPMWCLASDGGGWEHVSVSLLTKKRRMPNWDEMCAAKSAFWDSEDCVMQLHPRESEYVNLHEWVLHLWRPSEGPSIPEPPSIFVGPK